MRYRTWTVVVTLAVTLALAGPAKGQQPPAKSDSAPSAHNAFAAALYKPLAGSEKGNLAVSPVSAMSALAMAHVGARGRTAEQIAAALHLPKPGGQPAPHKDIAALLAILNSDKTAAGQARSCELSIANGLWLQRGQTFAGEFVQTLKADYAAQVGEVDFGSPPAAAAQINSWAGRATGDRIKDLVSPESLGGRMGLVLASAVYFRGQWDGQFKPQDTRDAPFYLGHGGRATVAMMNRTGHYPYAELDDFLAIKMPYQDEEFSMVVLVPRRTDGLERVEQSLTAESLDGWLARLRGTKVNLFLPRFRVEMGLDLAPPLREMGMKDAFTAGGAAGGADFSGINGQQDLFISRVTQKTYLEVNEKGSEAAAATAIRMLKNGGSHTPPVLRADRPFLYLIRHEKSGAILFLGRLVRPEPSSSARPTGGSGAPAPQRREGDTLKK